MKRQTCSRCLKTTDNYTTEFMQCWPGDNRRFHTCDGCQAADSSLGSGQVVVS